MSHRPTSPTRRRHGLVAAALLVTALGLTVACADRLTGSDNRVALRDDRVEGTAAAAKFRTTADLAWVGHTHTAGIQAVVPAGLARRADDTLGDACDVARHGARDWLRAGNARQADGSPFVPTDEHLATGALAFELVHGCVASGGAERSPGRSGAPPRSMRELVAAALAAARALGPGVADDFVTPEVVALLEQLEAVGTSAPTWSALVEGVSVVEAQATQLPDERQRALVFGASQTTRSSWDLAHRPDAGPPAPGQPTPPPPPDMSAAPALGARAARTPAFSVSLPGALQDPERAGRVVRSDLAGCVAGGIIGAVTGGAPGAVLGCVTGGLTSSIREILLS